MSKTDSLDTMESGLCSDRPGLEFPELESRKKDVCRGEEPRRSNMKPACEDKLMVSL